MLAPKCLIGPENRQLWAHRADIWVQAAKDRAFGGVERLLSGPFPPTAAYVVSANAAPFSDPGLVLGGILTLLPRHSPVLLLCARSSSHRLRLGIRPLERSRWILGPETIFRTFSVDCRTASRTAARACVRDPAGALGREGQSAAWSPGPASMAALRAGHLAEGARLRFRHYSGPRMSPLANVHEAAHPIRCVALGRRGHQAVQIESRRKCKTAYCNVMRPPSGQIHRRYSKHAPAR